MPILKSVDPISLAKIYGFIYLAIGVVYGVVIGLLSLATGSVAVGTIILIGAPIGLAILGFVTGIISAWLYNWAAGKWGGVRFVLEGYDIVKKGRRSSRA